MSRTKSQLQLNPISRDKVNLSCQTITTARAITLQPTKVFEVLPGDAMSIKMEQFNRVDGMPVSSFVQFYNRNVAFYVKNCQVWKPFDSYKSGAPYAFGYENVVPTKKPFISAWDLFFLFSHHSGQFTLTTYEDLTSQVQDYDDIERLLSNHAYDFILDTDGNHPVYGYKFTAQGRCVYKMLYSLGYRFPRYINPMQSIDEYLQLEMSLLPLMSYLSVLVNYYVPLKWRTYQFVNSMSYLVDPVPQHFQGTSVPESNDMKSWVDGVCRLLCYVYYGDDYFTSSLLTPMDQPNGGINGDVQDPNLPSPSSVYPWSTPSGGQEPVLYNSGEEYDAYSQYLVYALSCVTGQAQLSAMTLNDIKAATLAKFGYKAESADMVPYILEKSDDTINVSPVMSLANTFDEATGEGSVVGYKAGNGQGVAKLSGKFRFDTYGTLLFVNSIMPRYFYYNGIRRELLRVRSDEEFDRNFAKLGYQAIAKAELDIDVYNPMNTFGFTRKYADYAKGHDDLGGDFVINTANLGLDAFHFGRKVKKDAANNEAFACATTSRSLNPQRTGVDGYQFDRVFISTATDPIQQWYLFDIKATRQIESTMTVGDADGEVVETKPVGATLNS